MSPGGKVNSDTDLGTGDQRRGRLLEPWRLGLLRSVARVRWARTVGLFDRLVIASAHVAGPRDNLRLEPEPEACGCLLRAPALTSLHKHFEWTRRVFLSSRHFSHWDTGRPLRLISKSGRLVWRQEEVRCPLIQDLLVRVVIFVSEVEREDGGWVKYHANFLSSIWTWWE